MKTNLVLCKFTYVYEKTVSYNLHDLQNIRGYLILFCTVKLGCLLQTDLIKYFALRSRTDMIKVP